MTGFYRAVAPYRRLYVLQMIRYWIELLSALRDEAVRLGKEDIPYFAEIFRAFNNEDSYFKAQRRWDNV